jgi:hypothetical protein
MPATSRTSNMMITVAADGRIAVCGLPHGAWSIDYPAPFPPGRPLDVIGADMGNQHLMFAIAPGGQIWACGVPDGAWVNDYFNRQAFTAARFIGSGGQYLAALDVNGIAWVVGSGGGTWEEAQSLRLP